MYDVNVYEISRNLLNMRRWQAEIPNQKSRFARRAMSADAARRKIVHDENAYWEGHLRIMQDYILPIVTPFRRKIDAFVRNTRRRKNNG